MSGSFPALNIAVLAAIQSLGAQPVITSSVGASTWGANRPEYTWLDMERDLQDAGIWPWRTRAAGLGGVGDSGGGLSEEGVAMAQAAITRTGTPAIAAVNLAEAVQLRLTAYRQPNGQLPAALVNVGGSHVVFGDQGHRIVLRPGLLSGYQAAAPLRDGLAAAFLDANRPVIHLLNIVRLAAEYGIDPESAPGSSRVFYTRSLSLTVQAFISGWLAAILVVLWYGRRRRWWQGPLPMKVNRQESMTMAENGSASSGYGGIGDNHRLAAGFLGDQFDRCGTIGALFDWCSGFRHFRC